MQPADKRLFRVLILCTGNSARSQIAEAIFNRKGRGRFIAESAGSRPVSRVNPYAIEVLREGGIDWQGHQPRGLDGLDRERWDFVITVCDKARESCPIFPGQPILAHWGMPDPAAVEGDDEAKRAAFRDALTLISRRIDLLLALPVEKLERLALEARVQAIGEVGLYGSTAVKLSS
jgi:arsenate reductase (thioredoxin)